MPAKNLLLIFVKNIRLGKVKTRLARSIGDDNAFEVYKHLLGITERETDSLDESVDVRIYFSDVIIDTKWPGKEKFVQQGEDLGARMKDAFNKGFEDGYERIIGIGSDLPDLTAAVMIEGLSALEDSEVVFGPAKDGGYYLIGMKQMVPSIFENKPWSTEKLLELTLSELKSQNKTVHLLKELNDIDTLEDLKNSSVADQLKTYYELS